MLSAARDPCRALRAIGGAGPVLIAGAAAQVALGGFTPFLVSANPYKVVGHVGYAVRSDTLLSAVKSIQRGDFPTRRAAAARAAR